MDWVRVWKNHFHNRKMEVRDGSRLYYMAIKREKKERVEGLAGIETSIPELRSQADKSRVQERGFDRALKSGKYTEAHILAVMNP